MNERKTVQYPIPEKEMQECLHTICQNQGRRIIFKCELYHMDIGKSCFETFPPRRDVKYAAILTQGKFLPVHNMKAYRKGNTAVLILNLGRKWK